MSDKLPEGFTEEVKLGDQPQASAPPGAPPADTSPDQSRPPEGFSAAVAPQETSALPHMADRLKQGVSGLASLAGAPVSAINFGLSALDTGINAVTGSKGRHLSSEHPVGGMEQVKEGWDKVLMVKKIPAPTDLYGKVSKANEYFGAAAEFAGGSLFPGASATAAASRKLATAITIAAGDLSAATTSVEMKEWGGTLAPTVGLDKETGEAVGAMLGGFLGPKGVGFLSQKLLQTGQFAKETAAKQDLNGVGPEAQKMAAQSWLMKDLRKGLEQHPTSLYNLQRSLQLSKQVEGWHPTGAQASGAPGLIAMQKEVANKSGEALAKAAAVDQRNQAAIANYKDKVFPTQGKATVTDSQTGRSYTTDPVTDPARVKLAVNKQIMQMQVDKNARDLRSLSDQYRRTVDNEAIGDQLRAKYWQARDVAKIQQGAALGDVYATAKRIGIVEDMTDVREAVNKIVTSDRQTFQDMPVLFHKVLSEYPAATAAKIERQATTPIGSQRPIFRTVTTPANPGKSEASFEELHSLYKQANKDWAGATAAGDSVKAHYMAMIRDQLKAKVDKFNGPQYGELAAKFQAFNQGYAQYSRTFKDGAGGEIAKRTRSGLSTDSEDIVTKIILKAGDKKKGVQDFFDVFGSDEKAAGLLRDGLTDSFSRAVMKTGNFNPIAARNWLKQHEQAMGELLDLRKKFEGSQELGQDLVNRRLLMQKQRKAMDQTVLAKVAKSSNPEALIKQALGDSQQGPRVLKGLLVGAITKESKDSIARSIVDVVTGHPQNLEYILQHESTLKPVMDQLGKGHWENLKAIGEMEQIAGRVKAPTQVELSKLQDAGEQLVGTSVRSLFSKAMAAKQGRISEGYAVLDVAGRWFYKVRSEEVVRLREAAMFDPETAQLLATLGKQKSAPSKAQLLDLQRLSFNAGVVSFSEGLEELRRKERVKAQNGGGGGR